MDNDSSYMVTSVIWDEEREIPVPDVSNVITEDDTPVDNLFSEKQMRLLTESLHSSWQPGFPFVAMANVGLYVALNRPVVVPDVLVTTQVTTPEDIWQKGHRSYFTWVYDGKVPDIVVEIVSNKKGGELSAKMANYEHIGVRWYAVFDPAHHIQSEDLQIFTRKGNNYERCEQMVTDFDLGLSLWTGEFEGVTGPWLRWVDAEGRLIPTGKEKAAVASANAEDAVAKAEDAAAKAEDAAAKAEDAAAKAAAASAKAAAFAQKLRELGVDPDSVG